MTIRSGGIADEDACVDLWLEALEARDGALPLESSRSRAHAKFRGPVVRLGIAEGTSTPDGFALTVHSTDETALLELIAVRPKAARRGTGGALLDDAVAAAAASGYLRLDLWVRRGNDRAVGLYRSRGFAATGDHEAHPLGGEPMLRFSTTFD
jgi:ribosomal-protein-alanine N-acetyltransferase